jgi:pheromone shutdown protein TraB
MLKQPAMNYLFQKLLILVITLNFFQIGYSFVCKTPISIRKHSIQMNDDPQVLTFREPLSGVIVKLVGSMHYNPTSIALAEKVVETSAMEGRLRAVLIESCPTRWEKMKSRSDYSFSNTLLKNLFNNEMRSASNTATKYNIPTILADQEISQVNKAIQSSLGETFKELLFPFNGGWSRFASKLINDISLSLPVGTNYLGIRDYLDPNLLIMTPISLFRYILALIVKSPIVGIVLYGFLYVLPSLSLTLDVNSISEQPSVNISDMLSSASVSLLETLILSRVFLSALLTKRNIIIAAYIQRVCGKIAQSVDTNTKDLEVVAVLGMAHCNGVMKNLLDYHNSSSSITDNVIDVESDDKDWDERRILNFPL